MLDKRLFDLVPGCRLYVAGTIFFKWLALIANVVTMWVLGSWMNELIFYGKAMIERADLLILVAALGIRFISIYAASRIADTLSRKAKAIIRQQVYDKLLELGPSYAESVSASEAMQTAIEGANQLEVYYGGYLPQFIYSFLAPLTLFIMLVHEAGLAAVVLMIMVPLIPVSIVFIQKPARRAAKEYWASYVDLGGDFLEAVQGLTTLKIYQADKRWHDQMNDEAESFRVATMKMLGVQLRSIVIMDLFAYCGAAVGIVVAVSQFASGSISFIACFLIVFLSQEFFLPMRQLGSLFHAGMGGMAASRKMYEILDTKNPSQGDIDITAQDADLDITLDKVSYMYGERAAIKDVSFKIPSQGMFALVGESGSGKSTIAGILSGRKLGFDGLVTMRGVDYKKISSESLMRTITLVSSDAHLFEGSIRSNLLMAKPDATDEELMDALDRARIADFVRAAGGLDYKISEGATNVSGGQAQRLSLARALLRDSEVYIFDEATSNVDAASEIAIASVMRQLAADHVVIVVAHRLSLIKDAKTIAVMNKGGLIELGDHESLLAKDAEYARLWSSQQELADFATTKGYGHQETLVSADIALEDEPVVDEQIVSEYTPHRSSIAVLGRLIGLVKPLFPFLVLAVCLGVIGHMAAIMIPALGAYGMMAAGSKPLGLTVKSACILVIVAGVVRGPARYGEQMCNHYIAFRLLAHIRDLLFTALRKLAPAKLEGRGKGDVISLVTSDVELLEVFYAHTISPIAIALIVTAIMFGFFNQFSHTLALIALAGYATVGIVLPWLGSLGLRGKGAEVRSETGKINAYVLDQLRGISETIQYGREEIASSVLADKTGHVGVTEDSLKRRSAFSESLSATVIMLLGFWMLIAVMELCYAGVISASVGFVCLFTYLSSFGPVIAVCRLGTSLQQTIGSGERVLDLLDEAPQVVEVADGKDVTFNGASLDKVSFSYDSNGETQDILKDISLEFEDGSITCVNGRSGSGKSTILKLLMRFWDVDQGQVSVSGTNVRDINTSSLRDNEAYMTQNTYLFEGSIKDNICLANPDATDAQIAGAIKSASLEEFIARLPEGLDTQVGDLGGSLSGGERQRIGLARVFLHNAPFVLLDEPTSNLDALSEAAVMRAIAKGRSGKTIVLVSHRASTAAFADKFISIENGRLS